MKPDTLFKSIGIAVIASLATRLLSLVRGVLFARVLDPTELGTWALAINTIQIAASVAVVGLPRGFARYIPRLQPDAHARSTVLLMCAKVLCATICVSALGFLFAPQLGHLLFGDRAAGGLVALTLLGMISTVAVFVIKGVLHGLRLFRVDAVVDLASCIVFLGLVVVFFAAWKADANANVLAYLITHCLAFATMVVIVYYAMRPTAILVSDRNGDEAITWKAFVFFSLGTWVASSLHMVWRYLDRFMLLHLGDPTAADSSLHRIGDYFIATKLAEPLGGVAILISIVLLPHAAELWSNEGETKVGSMLCLTIKVTSVLLTLGGAILLLLKPLAFYIVAGYEPPHASHALAPVTVTVIVVSLYYVLRTYIFCCERTRLIVAMWSIALLTNALLNCWLIPRYSLFGAVIATMTSALIATFGVLFFSVREGLAIDFGTLFCCGLPVLLMLPVEFMLPALAVVGILILYTDCLLAEDEKEQIIHWCSRLMRWRLARPQQ